MVEARLVELLLSEQEEELSGKGRDAPTLLSAVVSFAPAADLWKLGSSLIGADDAETILGARLIRELPAYKAEAARLLSQAWTDRRSITFDYWMVSSFAFLPADLVFSRLVSASRSEFAEMRDAAATALSNVSDPRHIAEAQEMLHQLVQDSNAEVRFSAAFELASLWNNKNDLRNRALFAQLANSDTDERIKKLAEGALNRNL